MVNLTNCNMNGKQASAIVRAMDFLVDPESLLLKYNPNEIKSIRDGINTELQLLGVNNYVCEQFLELSKKAFFPYLES
jgi:hypothetical protein